MRPKGGSMSAPEKRSSDRVTVDMGGCANIDSVDIRIKVYSLSPSGALVEFSRHEFPIPDGLEFPLFLDIGVVVRARIVRTEMYEEATLYSVTFERFEFDTFRTLTSFLDSRDRSILRESVRQASDDYHVHRYAPYINIFLEGEFGDTAYIILYGRVGISKSVGQQKIAIAELGAGEIFGELALLTSKNVRTATAVTLDDTELIEINKDKFSELLQQTPQVISAILHALGKRTIESTSSMARQKAAKD
jgi:CRP-like cAMP-binding protein